MSLRAPDSPASPSECYEARLARSILAGAANARVAAMTLLEHREPATLAAAVSLVAEQGPLGPAAFDLLADAWESYRHLKNLSWD
jgi:hypothetical protein